MRHLPKSTRHTRKVMWAGLWVAEKPRGGPEFLSSCTSNHIPSAAGGRDFSQKDPQRSSPSLSTLTPPPRKKRGIQMAAEATLGSASPGIWAQEWNVRHLRRSVDTRECFCSLFYLLAGCIVVAGTECGHSQGVGHQACL